VSCGVRPSAKRLLGHPHLREGSRARRNKIGSLEELERLQVLTRAPQLDSSPD
jgi:hypothetical protein